MRVPLNGGTPWYACPFCPWQFCPCLCGVRHCNAGSRFPARHAGIGTFRTSAMTLHSSHVCTATPRGCVSLTLVLGRYCEDAVVTGKAVSSLFSIEPSYVALPRQGYFDDKGGCTLPFLHGHRLCHADFGSHLRYQLRGIHAPVVVSIVVT